MKHLLLILVLLLIFPVTVFAQVEDPANGLIVMFLKWAETHTWAQYMIAGFGVAKAISILFPSSWRGKPWYNYIMKVVNMGALEVGRAKNADDLPLKIANLPK